MNSVSAMINFQIFVVKVNQSKTALQCEGLLYVRGSKRRIGIAELCFINIQGGIITHKQKSGRVSFIVHAGSRLIKRPVAPRHPTSQRIVAHHQATMSNELCYTEYCIVQNCTINIFVNLRNNQIWSHENP